MKFVIFTIIFKVCLVCMYAYGPDDHIFSHLYPGRIVGGTNAPNNAATYMCSLQAGNAGSHFCGATIVNQWALLTAAHCIDAVANQGGAISQVVYARCGTRNLNSGGVFYRLYFSRVHDWWNPRAIKNDLGLVYTTTNIIFNNQVQPVNLVTTDFKGDHRVTSFGWGSKTVGGAASNALQQLDTTTMDHVDCVARRNYAQQQHGSTVGTLPQIEEYAEICSYHSAGHGICQGDSGSPLIMFRTTTQIGIASWGVPCAIAGPDVYTRTATYTDWIYYYAYYGYLKTHRTSK